MDVHARYFAQVAARLRNGGRYRALFVAVVSFGVAVSILAKVPGAPLSLSLFAALAVRAKFKVNKEEKVAASLAHQWLEIASEYRVLWSTMAEISDKTAVERHWKLELKHFPDALVTSELHWEFLELKDLSGVLATSYNRQDRWQFDECVKDAVQRFEAARLVADQCSAAVPAVQNGMSRSS